MIRRVKKSEATDGTHVRMKINAHNKGDLVRWTLVSMEVNQYERHDVFAGIESVPQVERKSSQSQSHGHRKIIANIDVAVAFFHVDMEDKICAHPPAEAEPDRTVVWLLIKAHYGTRKAARLWKSFCATEVFMKAGWDAVAVEPNVYHKAKSLGDDDDAYVFARRRLHVKAMLEHKVDINVISIIGPGKGTEAKIVESCWFHVESESQACA